MSWAGPVLCNERSKEMREVRQQQSVSLLPPSSAGNVLCECRQWKVVGVECFPVSPTVVCHVLVSAIPQQTHLHLNVGVLCSFARLGWHIGQILPDFARFIWGKTRGTGWPLLQITLPLATPSWNRLTGGKSEDPTNKYLPTFWIEISTLFKVKSYQGRFIFRGSSETFSEKFTLA